MDTLILLPAAQEVSGKIEAAELEGTRVISFMTSSAEIFSN